MDKDTDNMRLDEQQVYQWFDVFKNNNELVEIRLIGSNKTASGYFTNAETLIKAIKPYTDTYNVYFTINKVNPSCYGREQKDKIIQKPKNTTTDNEIVCRDFVLIDLDAKRLSGVCATKEEVLKAHEKGKEVFQFLINNGFYEPIMVFSSSGMHLYLKCSLLNNEENTKLVKRFLESLSMIFSDEYVEVDTKVYNAARISRLMGSYSAKGATNDKERPQRKCRFISVPKEIKVNEKEYFEKIANLYPEEEQPKPSVYNNYSTERFDLDEFIAKHNIPVTGKVEVTGGTKYYLEHCLFNEQHRGKDAILFQHNNGAIAYFCYHNSCQDKHWQQVRLLYEPDAYTRKNYEHNYSFRKKKTNGVFTPTIESTEKGKKWLQMSDIKRVDIEDLLSIQTGYKDLDKKIVGLFAGELTILSGLNACVDCDTEFFNGQEWKKISEYTIGDKVLQYNEDGTANLVYPQRYIKEPCDSLHLINTKFGVNQCLSDEHNVVYQTSKGNLAKKQMKDLIIQHGQSKHGFNGKFYTTFKYSGKGIELSDEQIRVMCAVICDGSFKNRFADKSVVRINLKKQRKKERLERLLKEANIEYRKEQYNPKDLEYNNYFFRSPRLEKEFGAYWYDCSAHQLSIIADEIMYWDGSLSHGSYSSTSKKNIDFIQFAFASVGKRTSIYIDNRVGMKHFKCKYEYKSVCYDLNICSNNMVSMVNVKNKTQIQDYSTKDGYKYCFTVPSGMLVLRRGGNINITGNSGKTSFLDCVALNVIQNGFKVAVWSGEMQDWRFQNWITQIAAGKNYTRKKDGYDNLYYVPNSYATKIHSWFDNKLFLYNNTYGSDWQSLFLDIKDLVEKEGVQLIIIDNLAALSIDSYDGEKYSKQTKFILEFKEFLKQKNICGVLVCHPRKENFFLRKESISGTADLTNIADNVFLLHRVGKDFEVKASEFFGKEKAQEFMQYGNVLEVAKNRQFGIVDFLVGMYFEPESRRLKNSIAEHIIYGWEEQYEQGEISYIQPNESFSVPQPKIIEEPPRPPLRSNQTYDIPKEFDNPPLPDDYDDDCPF